MTHKEKWWATMLEKHKSEEAVREFMRRGARSSHASTDRKPGGFATMEKERLSELSSRAAQIRWGKHETEQTTQSENSAESKETN